MSKLERGSKRGRVCGGERKELKGEEVKGYKEKSENEIAKRKQKGVRLRKQLVFIGAVLWGTRVAYSRLAEEMSTLQGNKTMIA